MQQFWLRARKPETLFTWTRAFAEALDWSFYLAAAIWWIQEADLSPLQLVSLGVVVQITILITEVPTGVVSDLLSRKRSIVLSQFLMGLSFMLVVVSREYWLLVPAQILGGLAWTLRSGADVAWLSDELKASGGHDNDADHKTLNAGLPKGESFDRQIEHILLRQHRLGMALASVGIVASIFIGRHSLELVIRLAGAGYLVLCVVTLALMSERSFVTGRDRGETFISVLRRGGRVAISRPRLRRLVVLAAGVAFAGEALDLLGLKRFLDSSGTAESNLVPLGLWFLAAVCTGFVANKVVTHQLGRRSGLSRIVTVMLLLAAFGIGLAALADVAAVIALGLLIQDGMRETLYPVLEGWVNRDAPSEVRATVHSLVSQAESVAEIVGGLLWGVIAQTFSVGAALLGISLLFVVVAWLAERLPNPAQPRRVGAD